MTAPALGTDNTEIRLEIVWSELAGEDAGNSDILGYQLYWDAGTGVADIALIETSSVSHLQSSLTPGQPYIFKLRARNIYGYGDFSSEVTFTPVNVPATMEPVTTALNFPNIDLAFVEPDDSGSAILTYEIAFFDNALGDYREVTALCDGSDAATIAAMSCSVPVSELISQLGCARGEVVLARARASNSEGFGVFSSPNSSTAIIQTVPA